MPCDQFVNFRLVRFKDLTRKMHPPPMAKKLLSQPRLTSEESQAHGWNPEDLSANMYVRAEDLSTVVRRPVANSTDGARGRLSYIRG